LILTEAGVDRSPTSNSVEVRNYVRALSSALADLERLPLSARLIRGIHARLLDDVANDRGQDKLPGEFKRTQNMIGGSRLDTARFIPPPPHEAVEAMSDLERYLNRTNKSATSPLIDMALVHYQFETIHPFADGNGRVGRMLISLMALSEGLLDQPVLYMSPELERVKDEYIDLMYSVSAYGAWEAWITFFLRTLTRSARRAIATIDRVLSLQTDYHERARAVSRSSNLLKALDMFFATPVLTASRVAEGVGVTDAAARTLLRQLTDVGIVAEGTRYPKIWLARELIAISAPEPL
jgi:Fic family protein